MRCGCAGRHPIATAADAPAPCSARRWHRHEAAAYAREWAAGYRYGSYYYRTGPGFVTVKDVRPGSDPIRMTISEGSGYFLAMARAQADSDLCEDAAALLGIVEQARLLIRRSGRLLVLPYRIRHWPVPYTAI